MEITAFDLAQRFIGVREIAGQASNPLILSMLKVDDDWPEGDEVPWCSAFINYICWLLRLPRSKSLRARSWLDVGRMISLNELEPRYDIIILKRGQNPTSGHVGFYAGSSNGFLVHDFIPILGGNQSDSVKVSMFETKDILVARRLYQ